MIATIKTYQPVSKLIKAILAVIVIHCCSEVNAQNGAFILAKTYDENEGKPIPIDTNIEKILRLYCIEHDSFDLEDEILQNPFMKRYFVGRGFASLSEKARKTINVTSPQQVFSGTGGLNVTNIARGLALFMIDRAKQELTIAFFERFRKYTSDNPEFRILFPNTTSVLDRLLGFHYSEMLSSLRASFYEDLEELAYNIDDIFKLKKYRTFLDDHPEIVISFQTLRIVHELESEKSPAQILSELAGIEEWKEVKGESPFARIKTTVKVADLFSYNLLDINKTGAWISFDDTKSLVKDTIAWDMFCGLLYELSRKKGVKIFMDKATIRSGLSQRDEKALLARFLSERVLKKRKDFLVRSFISELVQIGEKIEGVKDRINSKKSNGVAINNEDIYGYIDLSLQVIEHAFKAIHLFEVKFVEDPYLEILKNANELYRSIFQEQFSEAVVSATNFLNGLNTVINPEPKDTAYIKFDKVIGKITKYGLFMSNMVEAESPEEVKALIESTVLPVGSSSVKKNSNFNISIQSYLGAASYLGGSTENVAAITAWNDQWSVHAPVGIAFSHGLGKGGSLSAFFTLLDIGAIVDYELHLDTLDAAGNMSMVIEKEQKILFGQIFSPGAYAVYGLPWNLPVSIGIGGQQGPGLSKINAQSGEPVLNNPSWRWNFFIGVDIPLFNITNHRKSYKKRTRKP